MRREEEEDEEKQISEEENAINELSSSPHVHYSTNYLQRQFFQVNGLSINPYQFRIIYMIFVMSFISFEWL